MGRPDSITAAELGGPDEVLGSGIGLDPPPHPGDRGQDGACLPALSPLSCDPYSPTPGGGEPALRAVGVVVRPQAFRRTGVQDPLPLLGLCPWATK